MSELAAARAAVKARDRDALAAVLERTPRVARSSRLIVGACQGAWLDGASLLADHGADVNASYRGYRPLHALIQETPHGATPAAPGPERMACLEWLLGRGADPELAGAYPPTRAVLIAAFAGEDAMTRALLAAGARGDGFVSAALGDPAAVTDVLARKPSFAGETTDGGLTALAVAAGSRFGAGGEPARGRIAISAALLGAGADPNARARGWNGPVELSSLAVHSGQVEILTRLLEAGADPGVVLRASVWASRYDLAELALAGGAVIDRTVDGDRPLLNQLVRWGQVRAARWLLDRGASPNLPGPDGWTALHQAASRGNVQLVEALLQAGGDRSRRDEHGMLARDVAQAMGRTRLLTLLRA